MARIESVKKRLEEWARWVNGQDSGGLGYPRSSAFTRLTPRSAPQGFVPVGDDEAMKTQRAVQSLLPSHIDLWHTLQAYYVKGFDVARCASVLRVAESSVKARLCRADVVLDMWFRAQDDVAESAKRNKTA